MVGAIAANLHEGSRSEYLAQYLFASFGTAISVPHQEDSGIDLYCTLTERVGSRAWPRAYFSVQVKSTMDAWVLDGLDSVKWLVEHPLPCFLCIVDKSAARLRVYNTSPRFYVWSLPPLPAKLELVPTTDQTGRFTQWDSGIAFSLSAPILDVSVQDLLDEKLHQEAWNVLRFWVDVDSKNLARIRAGLHEFRMPDYYVTNTIQHRGWATQGIAFAPDLQPALEHLKECVAYLASQFHRKGDLFRAGACAMLLRRLFKGEDYLIGFLDAGLYTALNDVVPGEGRPNYLFRAADQLNATVDRILAKDSELQSGLP